MKIFFGISFLCALTATTWAKGNRYDCGNTRNEWYNEFVYLNSPDEYNGPGYIDACQEERTYTGGSKAGAWRVTYICHVSLK